MPHLEPGLPADPNPQEQTNILESQHSPEAIAGALKSATHYMYELTGSEEFEAGLRSAYLHPDFHFGTRRYHDFLAAYGKEQADAKIEAGEDPLYWKSVELIAATPLNINELTAYESRKRGGDYTSDGNTAMKNSSYYRSLMQFCEENPQILYNDLQKAMLNVVNITTDNEKAREAAPDTIRALLLGARSEIKTFKLAIAAGRTAKWATRRQDIQEGMDMMVSNANDTWPLRLDAKSSRPFTREGRRATKDYLVKASGVIAVYAACTEEDFRGYMVLPDEVAQEKADDFDTLLLQAEDEKRQMNRARRQRQGAS